MRRMTIAAAFVLAVVTGPAAYADEGTKKLGIADLIERVRSELVDSETKMREKYENPLFSLKELDLEVNVIIQTSTEKAGFFEIFVAALGLKEEYSESDIHKVRLRFEVPHFQTEVAHSPGSTQPSQVLMQWSPGAWGGQHHTIPDWLKSYFGNNYGLPGDVPAPAGQQIGE